MYKIFSWTAVLLWMTLIFNLSSQVAEQSNQLSTGITEVIVKTVEKVAPEAEFDIGSFNHIIRKNAHFFAYLVIGKMPKGFDIFPRGLTPVKYYQFIINTVGSDPGGKFSID